MSGMAEVLSLHSDYLWRSATGWECVCGHPILPESVGAGEFFAKHQAEELTAAGFGDVREAKAQALEEAAEHITDEYLQRALTARAAAVRGEG